MISWSHQQCCHTLFWISPPCLMFSFLSTTVNLSYCTAYMHIFNFSWQFSKYHSVIISDFWVSSIIILEHDSKLIKFLSINGITSSIKCIRSSNNRNGFKLLKYIFLHKQQSLHSRDLRGSEDIMDKLWINNITDIISDNRSKPWKHVERKEENEAETIMNDGLWGKSTVLWDQQHKAGMTKRDFNGDETGHWE